MDFFEHEVRLDNRFLKDRLQLVRKGSISRRRKPSRYDIKTRLSTSASSNFTGYSNGILDGLLVNDGLQNGRRAVSESQLSVLVQPELEEYKKPIAEQRKSAVLIQTWERRCHTEARKSPELTNGHFTCKSYFPAPKNQKQEIKKHWPPIYSGVSMPSVSSTRQVNIGSSVQHMHCNGYAKPSQSNPRGNRYGSKKVHTMSRAKSEQNLTNGSTREEPEWISLSRKLCAKFVQSHLDCDSSDSKAKVGVVQNGLPPSSISNGLSPPVTNGLPPSAVTNGLLPSAVTNGLPPSPRITNSRNTQIQNSKPKYSEVKRPPFKVASTKEKGEIPVWIDLSKKLCTKFIEEHIECEPCDIENSLPKRSVTPLEMSSDVRIIEKIGRKPDINEQKRKEEPEWIILSRRLRAKFIEEHKDDPDTISLDNQLNASDLEEYGSDARHCTENTEVESCHEEAPPKYEAQSIKSDSNFDPKRRTEFKFDESPKIKNTISFCYWSDITPCKRDIMENATKISKVPPPTNTANEKMKVPIKNDDDDVNYELEFETFETEDEVDRNRCFENGESNEADEHHGDSPTFVTNPSSKSNVNKVKSKSMCDLMYLEYDTDDDRQNGCSPELPLNEVTELQNCNCSKERTNEVPSISPKNIRILSPQIAPVSKFNEESSGMKNNYVDEMLEKEILQEFSKLHTQPNCYAQTDSGYQECAPEEMSILDQSNYEDSEALEAEVNNPFEKELNKQLERATNREDNESKSDVHHYVENEVYNKEEVDTSCFGNETNDFDSQSVENGAYNKEVNASCFGSGTNDLNSQSVKVITDDICEMSEEADYFSKRGQTNDSRGNHVSKTLIFKSPTNFKACKIEYDDSKTVNLIPKPPRSPVYETVCNTDEENMPSKLDCKCPTHYENSHVVVVKTAKIKDENILSPDNIQIVLSEENSQSYPLLNGKIDRFTVSKCTDTNGTAQRKNSNSNNWRKHKIQKNQEEKTPFVMPEDHAMQNARSDRELNGHVNQGNSSVNVTFCSNNKSNSSTQTHIRCIELAESNPSNMNGCQAKYKDGKKKSMTKLIDEGSYQPINSPFQFEAFDMPSICSPENKFILQQHELELKDSVTPHNKQKRRESSESETSNSSPFDARRLASPGSYASDSEASSWTLTQNNSYGVNPSPSTETDLSDCSMSVKCNYTPTCSNQSTLESRKNANSQETERADDSKSQAKRADPRNRFSEVFVDCETSKSWKKSQSLGNLSDKFSTCGSSNFYVNLPHGKTESGSKKEDGIEAMPESLKHLFKLPMNQIYTPTAKTSMLLSRTADPPPCHYYSTTPITMSSKQGKSKSQKPKKSERSSSLKLKDIAQGLILTFRKFHTHSKSSHLSSSQSVDVSHLAESNTDHHHREMVEICQPRVSKELRNATVSEYGRIHRPEISAGYFSNRSTSESNLYFPSGAQLCVCKDIPLRSPRKVSEERPKSFSFGIIPDDKRRKHQKRTPEMKEKKSKQQNGGKSRNKKQEPKSVSTVSRKVQQMADGTLCLVTTISGDTAVPGVYSDSADTASEISIPVRGKLPGESNC